MDGVLIWAIGIVILWAVGAVVGGYTGNADDVAAFIILAIFWPAWLLLAPFFALFFVLYRLGKSLRRPQ